MATFPTITCRAAFGQAFTNGSPSWTDISAYFRRASTRRGRSRLQRTSAQFGAGTATIALDNRDRRFDPTNTASPYYPNVQPGVLVNLRATWSGTTYDLFTGYVDNWPVRWPGRAEAETEISLTDLFGTLAKRLIVSAGYAAVVAADSPLGYWRLDDTAGSSVALDSSGNHYDGTPSGLAAFGSTGVIQSSAATAAQFGQSSPAPGDGYVNIPSAESFTGTGAWTIEAWVRATGTSHVGTIFSQRGPDQTTPGLHFQHSGAGGYLFFQIWDGTGVLDAVASNTPWLADLAVHHIVVTRSGTTLKFYVDGAAVTDLLLNGSGSSSSVTLSTNYSLTSATVRIGAAGADDLAGAFYGQVGQVATYNTALSSTRVAAHYKAGTPFVQQTTGARINAILDAVGFPASMRRVDAGLTTVPIETRSLATTTSLAYMQACETAEQGQLLIGADGYVEFHDRYDRYRSPAGTSLGTFGDGGGELGIPVGAFNLDFDTTELFNTVPVTRTGGATQVATDKTGTTGTDQIGERTAPGLSDVMLTSDADALGLAQWILADTKQPYFRLDQLQLDPRGDANLWPQVLGRVVNDVITANKHTVPGGGAAISLLSRIEGVDHTFGDLKWQTAFHLSQMGATSGWMIFDDATADVMNGVNRFGW